MSYGYNSQQHFNGKSSAYQCLMQSKAREATVLAWKTMSPTLFDESCGLAGW
jgi:hypothetical protein